MWISNSKEAGLFIVMANVDFSKGYKGITAFLVDKSNPGLKVGKKEKKLGIRASSTCTVNFEDCIVPKEDVLGKVGEGYKIAISTLNEGRIGIGAQMIGLARGTFDYTMPYLLQRKQFGTVIADFQGMEFQYAQEEVSINAGRLLILEAARKKEMGMDIMKDSAMAKLYASQVANQVSMKCIEMLGGVGFTREFIAEKFYRDCIVGKIYEGTSNICLKTIAQIIKKEHKK
jgi:short-chain 2-methylacyl-CoA dehydrogenase